MRRFVQGLLGWLTVALLLSACGGGGGGGASLNAVPVSSAGAAQSVVAGSAVTLDGSASADTDGDPLTFAWTLTSRPTGSAAVLAGATSAKPTFTPDVAGTYVATLVVSDGKASSAAATVPVTVTPAVANAAPVARVGAAQSVVAGSMVTLDGSASSDANGDMLTFSWTLTSRPAGSAAALTGATGIKPTFTPDLAGTYVASLVVNDGRVNSVAATATVTVAAAMTAAVAVATAAANVAPMARVGAAQNTVTGSIVSLDGSASTDANGDPLTFAWTLTSRPTGSVAALAGATSARPTFTADLAGTYVASLLVNDGKVNSTAATVTVTATVAATAGNAAPVAHAGVGRRTALGAVVSLDGSLSADPNNDPLTFAWQLVSRPTGSAAQLSSSSTSAPQFTADVAGQYLIRLQVSDGRLASPASSIVITAVPPVTAAVGLAPPSITRIPDLCLLSGSFGITTPAGTGSWNADACRVFGAAGSLLWVRIQNNTNSPVTLARIRIVSGSFDNPYTVPTGSQTIAAGEVLELALALWQDMEVSSAIGTFSFVGRPDLSAKFSGDTTLP